MFWKKIPDTFGGTVHEIPSGEDTFIAELFSEVSGFRVSTVLSNATSPSL